MIFPAVTIVKVVSVQIVGLAHLGRRVGACRRLPSQAVAKALGFLPSVAGDPKHAW